MRPDRLARAGVERTFQQLETFARCRCSRTSWSRWRRGTGSPTRAHSPPDGETATALFSLDETAKYFLVLTALCEPRLRDGSSAALPTDPQILDRLRRLPSCRHLTRSAVNFHLDYLALLPSHRGPV